MALEPAVLEFSLALFIDDFSVALLKYFAKEITDRFLFPSNASNNSSWDWLDSGVLGSLWI
ncbi:hypothetical protein METBIDRAFT_29507 [Metschnikowia bicuspidata var. bicuspidata NRRL YB-4993]|uniref:Uncharacterized protein n=1 Tax=Metschnikowia bicuspidata var. bicuspidata NRRL YB-4993 TaxID=869754 RepID=A0A1A0HGG8_9ASCO|nr:hypothetical protein METBIDRAFT_29507 [Metschnikowia bicuspidata var. bicuspidata NRRL YB-4993]OBA22948.1 hypothetical protein METBIDRAFT_29507 [Metschnikowia bicuspidata var. bicuspidata NRRL YB-4993]